MVHAICDDDDRSVQVKQVTEKQSILLIDVKNCVMNTEDGFSKPTLIVLSDPF